MRMVCFVSEALNIFLELATPCVCVIFRHYPLSFQLAHTYFYYIVAFIFILPDPV